MNENGQHDGTERFTSNRRGFVKTVAAGVGLAAVPGVSLAKNDSESEGKLPVHVSGKRKHQFKPAKDSDGFVHRERFVSTEVRSRNDGKKTVHFEPETVHRDRIPEKYKNPDRAFNTKYSDRATLGSFEQHMRAERRERAQARQESTASTGTATVRTSATTTDATTITAGGSPSGYDGPLYTYSSGDLDERTAPINVSWYENDFTASNVKSDMLDEGWGSIYTLSTSKYVGYSTDDGQDKKKKEDKHVKQEGGLIPGEQWHGRLYNIPSSNYDGHTVIGAAHRDPADHGWLPGGQQWRFADSRQKFLDVWEDIGNSTENQDAGNGGNFSSSNGKIGVVY